MNKNIYEPPKMEYCDLETEDVLEVSPPGKERTVGEDDTRNAAPNYSLEEILWLVR